MNVLIYHTINQSAKDIEALAEAFVINGHEVYLLTHSSEGTLHDNIKSVGGKVYTVDLKSKSNYLNQLSFLVKFCNSKKINVVYSNLQQCSKISIFAQYFTKAKFIIYRHHSDSVYLYGTWKEKLIDILINMLSKKMIVISNFSYNQVVEVEKVKPSKVQIIPLGYYFNKFTKPNQILVNDIKEKYSANLLLVTIGRLISIKRIEISINVVGELVKNGFDVKLLIVGTGELENDLKQQIRDNNLEDFIFLTGFVTNVVDYIAASDLLIHTSVSEASCHMPKEAGVLNKTILVCENVGDFSDYIVDNVNGIVIDKENVHDELKMKLIDVYSGRIDIKRLGSHLRISIEERFGMSNIIKEHEKFLTKIYKQ